MKEQQGEAATPPPVAVDLRRDWGVHLGQRLRKAEWLPGQVDLVGAMECRTPDPLYVLYIGGRYQVDHRAVRRARLSLSLRQQAAMTLYQEREDDYVKLVDEDGRAYYKPRAPEMRDDEADAYRALWRALWDAGALRRLAHRAKSTSTTTENL